MTIGFNKDPTTEILLPITCKINSQVQNRLVTAMMQFRSLMPNSFISLVDLDGVHGIYSNDAIHWFLSIKSSICYFDLNRECVNESRLPVHLVGCVACVRYLGESQGHLHLVSVVRREISPVDVYELKIDYSGWSLKYRVDFASIAIALPQKINSAIFNHLYKVFSILVDEEERLTMVLEVGGHVSGL